MSHFSEQNYYEILEITPDATAEEIQKAFYRTKQTYSPNSPALYSVFSEDEASQLLKLIDEAYAILSNNAKRRDYDNKLFNRSSAVEPKSSLPTSTENHDDLPDFMRPDSHSTANMTAPNSSYSHTNNIAANTQMTTVSKMVGKTLVSHYSRDDEFENEIQNQSTFDGTFLQKIRNYKNISLDQISETSRVSRPYLAAIENNDFHSLPAPVYVRGFVVSYAKLLGLNEKKVADSFMKLYKDSRGSN